MKLVFNWLYGTVVDIETDNLLDSLTKCHVLSYQMWNKDAPQSIRGDDHERLKKFLQYHIEKKIPIIGHNFIMFDAPALEKVLGIDLSELIIVDTLALTFYLNTFRKQHGLDSFFSDYGIAKPKIEQHQWSIADDATKKEKEDHYKLMAYRCEQDVRINKALWDDLKSRLIEMYTRSKDMIDAGMVGGKRLSNDEAIYIDKLVGMGVNEHIDRILTFLMFKMDTYRIQEKVGIKVDREWCQKYFDELGIKIDEIKVQLEAVMPKVPKYKNKKRPKEPFKKDGTLSVSGLSWQKVIEQFKAGEKDEFGTPLVRISKNEDVVEIDDELLTKPLEELEGLQVFDCYEAPNANSPDQIKNLLYSHGWVPRTFAEIKDKPAITAWNEQMEAWRSIRGKKPKKPERPESRQVPQVTKAGDDGKELCPSVIELAEEVPAIMLYANLNLMKHRHSVLKGFLEASEKDGRILASMAGFTNTLRMMHRGIVNLVGVDKQYGKAIRGALIADLNQILAGSDLASLEDRTKHHFMLPHDPDYVNTMMEDDFDPHLLMAVTAGFITKQEMADYKAGIKAAHVAKGRKLGKSCLPVDNTEVFTRKGWKYFDQITLEDEVLSLDGNRNQVWCPISDKIFYKDQPVIEISHRSWGVESTGNHRWLVDKRIRTKSNPRVQTLYAETDKLVGDMNIITTGEYTSGQSSVTPDEARLLAWVLSDGCLICSTFTGRTAQGSCGRRQSVKMSIAQSESKYVSEIRDVLSNLGINYTEIKANQSEGVKSFVISSPSAREFLKKMGLPLLGKHQIDYTDWIVGLTKESRQAFIEAFWLADGWSSAIGREKKSLTFYQNKGKICDALKLALHLDGKNVVSHTRSDGVCETITAQARPHVTCQKLSKSYTRDTDVFCLTTDNGNFVIRQNGTITVTGNCNYAAVYGAGGPTIAKTAGVDDGTGMVLHGAYWKLNWSVKAISDEQVLVEFSRDEEQYRNYHKLWLVNPVNGFLYSVRSKKDVFSTLCQGTGSFFFDMWVDNILEEQKKRFNMQKIQLSMHDEVAFGFKDTPRLRATMSEIIKNAIYKVNDDFMLRRKLDCDTQFGLRYSDIH